MTRALKEFTMTLLVGMAGITAADPVATLVENGEPRAQIRVTEGLMAEDTPVSLGASYAEQRAEIERRRLRDSVLDLVLYVQRMSGAELSVLVGRAADGVSSLPIYVGTLARDVFGAPAKSYPYEQGWRMVVAESGIGLVGESDLSASYALYELLHRLGCRWYMPGPLGEHVPQAKTLQLGFDDFSSAPSTVYRGVWSPPTRSDRALGKVVLVVKE